MVISAERGGGSHVDWRMPGLKDGPELGARLIELAERAALAHEARAEAGEDMGQLGAAGARIAPDHSDPRPTTRVRWSGAAA